MNSQVTLVSYADFCAVKWASTGMAVHQDGRQQVVDEALAVAAQGAQAVAEFNEAVNQIAIKKAIRYGYDEAEICQSTVLEALRQRREAAVETH